MKTLRPPFKVNWLSIARFSLPGNVMFVKSKFLKIYCSFLFHLLSNKTSQNGWLVLWKAGIMSCSVLSLLFTFLLTSECSYHSKTISINEPLFSRETIYAVFLFSSAFPSTFNEGEGKFNNTFYSTYQEAPQELLRVWGPPPSCPRNPAPGSRQACCEKVSSGTTVYRYYLHRDHPQNSPRGSFPEWLACWVEVYPTSLQPWQPRKVYPANQRTELRCRQTATWQQLWRGGWSRDCTLPDAQNWVVRTPL